MYADVRADVQRSWAGEIRFCLLQFVFKFDFALFKTGGANVLVRKKATYHTYGAPADSQDDYLRMAESTILECFYRFYRDIVGAFGPEYL